MKENIRPLYKNRLFGFALMLMGIFATLIIIHRFCYYVYEFDPKFSPVDYGKFNFLSFFTVQSNIFVCFYLIISALAVFGSQWARKIAFNPLLGALVTTYITVTGVVYCCGIPLGFTPPFTWDTPGHSITSFIQVFHHMIIPPFMILLWFIPPTDKKLSYKKLWAFSIYPVVYIAFSMARGAVSDPQFYPYPFFNPTFLWDMFFKGRTMNLHLAYLMQVPLIISGLAIFVGVGALTVLIHNKRIKQK